MKIDYNSICYNFLIEYKKLSVLLKLIFDLAKF